MCLLLVAAPAWAGLSVAYDADYKALKKNVFIGDPLGFELYETADPYGGLPLNAPAAECDETHPARLDLARNLATWFRTFTRAARSVLTPQAIGLSNRSAVVVGLGRVSRSRNVGSLLCAGPFPKRHIHLSS